MKKIVSIMVILAVLLGGSLSTAASTGAWVKYTAADGSFSFHYPEGWKATADQSAVSIDNAITDEQLLMAMMTYDKGKSPTDMADGFVAMLKKSNPDVKASNCRTEPDTVNSKVVFDLTDKVGEKQYSGSGMVIKDSGSEQAIWFSYTAPASAYSRDRGLALLEGFMGSIASGAESKAPGIIYNPILIAKIDANAKGFMFVLEFALGAPFTGSQEQIILDKLKSGWRLLPEKELDKYDQYPVLAKAILSMGQKDLEELRSELEKNIREWLEVSPDSDETVKIIREQLKNMDKKVIDGDPPLTEMTLTAYSEIIAYSRLLRQDSKAMPEQISQDSVKDIKKQVQDAWKSFTAKERQQILTTPGLWICQRTLLSNGSESEHAKVREDLLKLTPDPQRLNGDENAKNSEDPINETLMHNSLMAIQNMNFNMYMWSRGFNYTPYGRL